MLHKREKNTIKSKSKEKRNKKGLSIIERERRAEKERK